MSVRRVHEATDCEAGSTDWTTIGARIVEAARVVSVVDMAQRAWGSDARQGGEASPAAGAGSVGRTGRRPEHERR